MEKLYINGEWVDSKSNDVIEVENPATMEIFARVPAAHGDDVDAAVAAAKEAFKTWSKTDLKERIRLTEAMLDMMKEELGGMAQIVMKELGSPYKWSRNAQVKGYFTEMQNFIDSAKNFEYEEVHEEFRIIREPVGVVACITPWNYPLGQIVRKVVPAVLAGNTVVLKPSKQTPLIAIEMVKIMDKVGFPKGVVNLVTGRGGEVGNALCAHKDVDLVSFTGSVSGGVEVGKKALDTVKILALELGGKSPAVIIPGADLDVALDVTLDKIFLNTGQTCSALSRLLVQKDHKAEVMAKIEEKMKNYKVGAPDEEGAVLGPLSSRKQYDKVRDYLKLGIEEGATLSIGEVPPEEPVGGYYVSPAVFTNVDNSMRIAQEEIFGPVLCVIEYSTIEEAVEIANDTLFGLNGAVFAKTIEEAIEVAKEIKSGNVVVNEGGSRTGVPFGGYKHSGIGRECGTHGFDEFLEVKAILGWRA